MIPKRTPYRNKKILQSAKGEACTMLSPECNRNSDTVVFCHSNYAEDGYGMGQKSDDIFGFYGCSSCHRFLDEGHAPRDIKRDYFHMAMKKTWRRLIDKGILK